MAAPEPCPSIRPRHQTRWLLEVKPPDLRSWHLSGRLAPIPHSQVPVDRLRSAQIRLDEVNEAFDRFADAAVVRQVFMFD